MTLPETGASTMSAPFSRTFFASDLLTPGLTVLMSISQDGATNHLSRSSAGYAAIEESGAEPHTKGIGRND
jgi:hypothetical protein